MRRFYTKNLVTLVMISILILIIPIRNAGNTSLKETTNIGKWTIMLYDDADGCGDILDIFSKEASSGSGVRVVALQDTTYDTAKLWYIDEYHNREFIADWGEVDMGSGNILEKFIKYCKEYFSAKRYFLAIYNHGGGWMGACSDETNDGWMTMDEMRRAIHNAGGVDIIAFTAPCLMGAIESVYELRECVDVYLGSEPTSSYYIWEASNTIRKLCSLLKSNPEISSVEIGRRIVEWMRESSIQKWWFAMSACETNKSSHLVEAIDKLSRDMMYNLFYSYDAIKKARIETHEVDEDWDFLADLYDFLQKYEKYETNQTILQDIQNVKNAFNNVIINEYHASGREGCHGLSIYFPDSRSYFYSYDYLLFSFSCNWEEFLRIFSFSSSKLKVEGSFNWNNVRPGGYIRGEIIIKNTGVPDSVLEWKIQSWPSWGKWTFRPFSGSIRAGEEQTVKVIVKVPAEIDSEFTGSIKIINTNNEKDYEYIPVSITTSYNRFMHENNFLTLIIKSIFGIDNLFDNLFSKLLSTPYKA